MLLKHSYGMVLLVTDKCDDYFNRVTVNVENGITKNWDGDDLLEAIDSGELTVISDSELSILSYE